MANQIDFREKIHDLTGGFKHFWNNLTHKDQTSGTFNQADGRVDVKNVKSKGDLSPRSFLPDGEEAVLSDGSSRADNLVWETERASEPDKSYAFDEENTDADYDNEDDLNFGDNETDTGSGQQDRYS